jgi:hypothetical protein
VGQVDTLAACHLCYSRLPVGDPQQPELTHQEALERLTLLEALSPHRMAAEARRFNELCDTHVPEYNNDSRNKLPKRFGEFKGHVVQQKDIHALQACFGHLWLFIYVRLCLAVGKVSPSLPPALKTI